MSSQRLFLLPTLLIALATATAQPLPERTLDGGNPHQAPAPEAPLAPRVPKLEVVFGLFKTDRASLSPDGKHLAYTLREEDKVSVVILEVDNPAVIKTKVAIIDSEGATAMLDPNNREKTPGAIRWMRWVSNTRLVLESNLRVALSDGTSFANAPTGGAIIGLDADGGNARILCTAHDTSTRDIEVAPSTTGATERTAPIDASTPRTSTLAASPETTLAPEENAITSTLSARAPHVYDLIPGDPDHVLIRTDPAINNKTQTASYTIQKLNVHTGKLTNEEVEFLDSNRTTLLDRQGHARVSVPISYHFAFPHVFHYSTTSLFSKAKPLDTLTGMKDAFVVSPQNYFGRRCVPLAFAEDGHTLYYASNLNRDAFGIYAVDIKTGKQVEAAFEHPVYDLYEPAVGAFPNYNRNVGDDYNRVRIFGFTDTVSPDRELLVFDRFERKVVGVRYQAQRKTAAWLKPEMHAAQIELEALMPGSNVDIQEWDQARNRFLVHSTSTANPGTFYVYDRPLKRLYDFVSAEPLIDPKAGHTNAAFSFKHPTGETVSGLLTLPRFVRKSPPPLIIVCDSKPWERVRNVYKPEVQAFASLGFAVAQISSRAAWGTGVKARTSANAEAEKTYAADLLLAANQLCQHFKFNRQRVGLYGDGMGAFCALWTLQLYPEAFRCAVVVNPVLDPSVSARDARNANGNVRLALEQSFFGGIDRMGTLGLSRNSDKIIRPVCFLQYRGPEGEMRNLAYVDARSLFGSIQDRAKESEFFDLDRDYMSGLAGAKSEAFRNIGGFLNVCLYGFKTETGATKIIEELTQ